MRNAAAGVCHSVRLFLLLLLSACQSASVDAEDHRIEPGQSPQALMDRAAAGDRLVFLPGLHQHVPGRHRALLYVDKSIEIELQEGAVLKLADDACQLEPEGSSWLQRPRRADSSNTRAQPIATPSPCSSRAPL